MSYINETDSQFIYSNLLILDLQNKLYPGGLLNPGRKLEFGTWQQKEDNLGIFSYTQQTTHLLDDVECCPLFSLSLGVSDISRSKGQLSH